MKNLINFVLDFFRLKILYHAGALSFSFIMAIVPLMLGAGFFLHMFLENKIDNYIYHLSAVFPDFANKIIKDISYLEQKRLKAGIIGALVSLYFSTGFIKDLDYAIALMWDKKDAKRIEFMYFLYLMFFVVIFTGGSVYLFYISLVFKHLNLPLEFTKNLSYLLFFTIFFYSIYSIFIPIKNIRKIYVFAISIVESLALLLLKYVITVYISHLLIKSIVYASLWLIIAFLIWIDWLMASLLLGARALYYIHKSLANNSC
ncbi:MAG: ribonuclease BN [Hydrogenobaculum sp.]|nr:MAG: ribonuclease BN [Hydrogenobaculum sp.]